MSVRKSKSSAGVAVSPLHLPRVRATAVGPRPRRLPAGVRVAIGSSALSALSEKEMNTHRLLDHRHHEIGVACARQSLSSLRRSAGSLAMTSSRSSKSILRFRYRRPGARRVDVEAFTGQCIRTANIMIESLRGDRFRFDQSL
jgi:hypothetical protein